MENATVEAIRADHVKANSTCRACDSPRLHNILDLGPMPLANRFLTPEEVESGVPEPVYPLEVYSCEDCGLLQLVYFVSPEVLFCDYIYVSTSSETLAKHFASLAADIKKRLSLGPSSLVVEVASNDGLLLKKFRDLGIRGIGIEPAVNLARMAREDGLEVVNEFFNLDVARSVLKDFGGADAILANNVFAHVDGVVDFLKGVALLLKPAGGFTMEVV